MARSGSWVKGLFPKNSNHGLRTLSLLVSLYFLGFIYDSLLIVTQIQRRSFPIAGLQPQRLKDVDEPDLVA